MTDQLQHVVPEGPPHRDAMYEQEATVAWWDSPVSRLPGLLYYIQPFRVK